MFSLQEVRRVMHAENEERQIALEYVADAWNAAETDGVDSEALSHASLFAALATLVRLYGEETTSKLIAELPGRIELGEYSLDRIVQ
ncbi:MAG: hypothetical protein KDJ19_02195 [Hyphomicrobiaceae bacterium]|nr:hypothetical protein [Hyphomicrobiaceae bacterium]MCC0023086.1 hypothetical protein [Hyphomicrobiaceae bacterium]